MIPLTRGKLLPSPLLIPVYRVWVDLSIWISDRYPTLSLRLPRAPPPGQRIGRRFADDLVHKIREGRGLGIDLNQVRAVLQCHEG